MSAILPFSHITNYELKLLYTNKTCIKSLQNSNYLSISQVNKIINIQNKLSILLINSRSLNKNFSKLETLINMLNFEPTVILVSETWVNSTKPLLYSLNNYNFYNNPGKNKAGGSGLFIRKSSNFKIFTNYKLEEGQL